MSAHMIGQPKGRSLLVMNQLQNDSCTDVRIEHLHT